MTTTDTRLDAAGPSRPKRYARSPWSSRPPSSMTCGDGYRPRDGPSVRRSTILRRACSLRRRGKWPLGGRTDTTGARSEAIAQ